MNTRLDLFAVAGRVAVGASLLFAGLTKLRDRRERFLRAVLGYELITGVWAFLFGMCSPLHRFSSAPLSWSDYSFP
jgi:uncharacterized membrane protein YphA (DoxX/SURF4 family)